MKAKLQKQLAYKYNENKVYKHVIVLPDTATTEHGWKGGQELKLIIKDGKLVIESKNKDQESKTVKSGNI